MSRKGWEIGKLRLFILHVYHAQLLTAVIAMSTQPLSSFAPKTPTRYLYPHSNHSRDLILTKQCLSAQCIYCQSVRAKNTSRQRSHLLECTNYLNAMKEHNPNNSILELATNGTPTPAMKTPKKRDLDAMMNGFQGDSVGTRSFPIPRPTLERDFQMCLQLSPNISIGPGIWGHRNWLGYISGHWNGRFGKGTVVVSSPHILLPLSLPRMSGAFCTRML